MTSLEGVPHRAVTAPDLRFVVTGAASYRPVLTLANGTLMARRSCVDPRIKRRARSRLRPSESVRIISLAAPERLA